MTKLYLTLIICLTHSLIFSQTTELYPEAEFTGLTLEAPGSESNMSVTFNPEFNLYYAVQGNYAGVPMGTYNIEGNLLSVNPSTIDYRGFWWNENTHAIQGNGYGSTGIHLQVTDSSSGYAVSQSQQLFSSNQPHNQSLGTYSVLDNAFIYLDGNQISLFDANSNQPLNQILLTGVPNINTTVNPFVVLYVGLEYAPYAVVDGYNSEIHLISASGMYVQTVQLPSEANPGMLYGYSYCNGLLWVFDWNEERWEAFQFYPACTATNSELSVELCPGESYNFGGELLNEAGIFSTTLVSSSGCDSIVELTLSYIEIPTITETYYICAHDSINLNGTVFSSSGEFTETFSSAFGCDSLVKYVIREHPEMDVYVEHEVEGNRVQFTDNTFKEEQRFWDFGDGNFSTDKNPVHSYSLPGIYQVHLDVLNEHGCSAAATTLVEIEEISVTDPSVEAPVVDEGNEDKEEEDLLIYPDAPSTIADVYLYDLNGRLLKIFYQIETKEEQFYDLSSLPNGVYILHASSAFVEQSQKIVVQN